MIREGTRKRTNKVRERRIKRKGCDEKEKHRRKKEEKMKKKKKKKTEILIIIRKLLTININLYTEINGNNQQREEIISLIKQARVMFV